MAITLASGFPTSNNASGLNTLSYTVVNIGDLIVLQIRMYDTTATRSVSSISGGGVTTWTRAGTAYTYSTTGNYFSYETWYGVSTSTGAKTATVTYSATPNQICELVGFELISGLGSSNTWGVAAGQSGNTGSSTTHTWPTLTSDGTHTLQAYLGYDDYSAGSITSVSTGFTGYVTSYANEAIFFIVMSTS